MKSGTSFFVYRFFSSTLILTLFNKSNLTLGIDDFLLPCLNKQLFGLDCPGCGAQRSLILFIKGEFAAAFAMYPAIFTLVLLAAFLVFNFFVKFRLDYQIRMGLIYLNAAIIIISYIIKITT